MTHDDARTLDAVYEDGECVGCGALQSLGRHGPECCLVPLLALVQRQAEEIARLTGERDQAEARTCGVIGARGAKPHPLRIPWALAAKAWSVYAVRYGGQSLERINERGGFHVDELDEFVPGWREEVSEIAAAKAQLSQMREALTFIRGAGCENYTSGSCRDHPERNVYARYTADRWCDPCIADAALLGKEPETR